jgi:O-antigen/teichoic acid export membrane protein
VTESATGRPEPASDRDPQRTISGSGAAGVGIASLVAAGCGYLVLLLAARSLDPSRNADFLLFWSLLFGVYGVLGGVQSETTRASHTAGTSTHGARLVPWGVLLGGAAAVVVAATAPLWGTHVLGNDWVPAIVALCLGAVMFAGHSAVAGVLAGRLRWGGYSVLVGAEAATRLLLVVVVVVAGAAMDQLELAVAVASGAWLVLTVLFRPVREVRGATADVATPRLLANTGKAAVAAASSAALVVGFPVLLRVTSGDAEFASAAPLILAISVTRAPLLMPLAAYQGVAITHFMANRHRGFGALARVLLLITGIGVAASLAAAVVGPWLLRVLFGSAYGVPGPVLAGLTLGATALAVLTMTGAAVLATGQHTLYAVGWLAATVTSLALLLVPLSIEGRAVLALAVGPLVGIVIHGVAVQRASRVAA